MTEKTNRQWRLASRPLALLEESNFSWHEEPIGAPAQGEVLVRNVYLSLDPANRGWVTERATYVEPVALGEVMRGLAVGVVEESNNPAFAVGDVVYGMIGWQEYLVSDGQGLQVLPRSPFPLTSFLAAFGMVGITAYFGLLDIGRPQPGETLVVSGAAGAVGSLVGQIGKIHGCRVVGTAGTPEKCTWITDELGFDGAIDYHAEDVGEALDRLCPDGIDVFFDNVGGKILDEVLARINNRARISVCGMISQYNSTRPVRGPRNFMNVLVKRARIEGFIVIDYMDRAGEAVAKLMQWHAEGRLAFRVHVVDGLKSAPQAINRLFDGNHQGKLIVKVSEEP